MAMPVPVGLGRTERAAIEELAAWLIVAAAERLATEATQTADRVGLVEVARRLRQATRTRWHNPGGILAASPIVDGPDGEPVTLVETVAQFHEDTRTGIRAAETCLLARGWRLGERTVD